MFMKQTTTQVTKRSTFYSCLLNRTNKQTSRLLSTKKQYISNVTKELIFFYYMYIYHYKVMWIKHLQSYDIPEKNEKTNEINGTITDSNKKQ